MIIWHYLFFPQLLLKILGPELLISRYESSKIILLYVCPVNYYFHCLLVFCLTCNTYLHCSFQVYHTTLCDGPEICHTTLCVGPVFRYVTPPCVADLRCHAQPNITAVVGAHGYMNCTFWIYLVRCRDYVTYSDSVVMQHAWIASEHELKNARDSVHCFREETLRFTLFGKDFLMLWNLTLLYFQKLIFCVDKEIILLSYYSFTKSSIMSNTTRANSRIDLFLKIEKSSSWCSDCATAHRGRLEGRNHVRVWIWCSLKI